MKIVYLELKHFLILFGPGKFNRVIIKTFEELKTKMQM